MDLTRPWRLTQRPGAIASTFSPPSLRRQTEYSGPHAFLNNSQISDLYVEHCCQRCVCCFRPPFYNVFEGHHVMVFYYYSKERGVSDNHLIVEFQCAWIMFRRTIMRRRFPKARMSVVDPFLRLQTKQRIGNPFWSTFHISFTLDRPDNGRVFLWMNTPLFRSAVSCHPGAPLFCVSLMMAMTASTSAGFSLTYDVIHVHEERKQIRGGRTENGQHLVSAFLTSGHSKSFTILTSIHPFTHTITHQRRGQPCQATASSSGAVRVRRLAQGHLD